MERLVDVRPTWPFYWANIAALLVESGMIDGRQRLFKRAFENALLYGPYEYKLQRQMLGTMIPIWYSLDVDQRQRLLETVAAHCRYRAGEAAQLVNYSKSPRVSRLIEDACVSS
ncbi:MAG: hypothetical protein OXT49_07030 [Gammaproteobacteria bacterium]|nr:hypothetical protein [Gammaproteobacteria bacterium]